MFKNIQRMPKPELKMLQAGGAQNRTDFQSPPFKRALSVRNAIAQTESVHSDECCKSDDGVKLILNSGRARLTDLNPHFHCSVIGTCLNTAGLKKILSGYVELDSMTELEVHHTAVSLANEGGPAAKSLHKALDQRYQTSVQKFGNLRNPDALGALWDECLAEGEIPGAYWALLTHRDVTTELRQKAFGDVHMLSHLVGTANRADIRRLIALENDNAKLQEGLELHQQRTVATLSERDQTIAKLQKQLIDVQGQLERASMQLNVPEYQSSAEMTRLIAIQTERREKAEHLAQVAQADAEQLRSTLEHLRQHVRAMDEEMSAAESQLRALMLADEPDGQDRQKPLEIRLRNRRILYVGGRPSSTPAIRNLVLRHGGEFQRHDGGLEDRKGLLAAAVAGADLVVFPVDCIDHDSAGVIKRLCTRQAIPYLPMRRASVAGFVLAISSLDGNWPAADANVKRLSAWSAGQASDHPAV